MSGLRNLGYDDLVVCYIVGILTDVSAERSLTALRDLVRSPGGAMLHRLRTERGRWKRVERDQALAAVPLALEVTDQDLAPEALVARALETDFPPGRLPVRIYLSGGVLAFALPHTLFDGTGATAVVSAVVDKLARPGADDRPALPVARTPLRRTLKKVGQRGVGAVLEARRTFRALTAQTETGYQFPRTLTKAESVRRTRMVSMVLARDVVRTIAATPENAVDGGRPARPPVSVKTASLVLRYLRDVDREQVDFRVVVPVDARRWVERGVEVEGNFSPSIPMGRLLVDDWSATALAQRISASTKAGVPVLWLLASTLVSLKEAVRHPLASRRPAAEAPRVPVEIHVSLPATEVTVDESLLPQVDDRTFVGGAPAHRRLPLGVWVEIAPLRDCLHVIIRDETGVFDLDAFPERFTAMIAAAAEAGGPR